MSCEGNLWSDHTSIRCHVTSDHLVATEEVPFAQKVSSFDHLEQSSMRGKLEEINTRRNHAKEKDESQS